MAIKSSRMSYSILRNLKGNEVQRFTLRGERKHAKVASIYDGDTLDLAFYRDDKMKHLVRYKCRMSGYDAPEMDEEDGELTRDYLAHLCTGGKVFKPVDFQNVNGILSKDQLQTKLDQSNRLVFAEFGREGKYGRPVVVLYQTSSRGNPPKIETELINDMMTKFVHELDQDSSETSSDSDMS